MPELKNTFQGGKMDKDKDERILPNGQYREALNISVATSEDSDVGAAQNILGNICVTQAIKGTTQTNTTTTGLVNDEHKGSNFHVTQIVDPQSDMLYRFVHTSPTRYLEGVPAQTHRKEGGVWMDRIVEYDTTKPLDASWQDKENSVCVDIFKVITELNTYEECGGKSTITVDRFTNQLRWGMKVGGEDVFIEDIDYNSGKIYLDGYLTDSGGGLEFTGNRNLNFNPGINTITGLNIIDGMLFWTDNYSEPKKIDIKRSKMGSKTSLWSTTTGLIGRYSGLPIPKIDDFNQHTILVVAEDVTYDCFTSDLIGAECGGDKRGGYTQDTEIDTSIPVVVEEEEDLYIDQGGPVRDFDDVVFGNDEEEADDNNQLGL